MRMFWKKKYSSDEALKIVAASFKQQIIDSEVEYNDKAKVLDEIMHIEPDPDILNFARAYDRRRKQYRWKKTLQTVAIVLVCVIVTNGIALETSEAFRSRVYSLFFNDEEGSVTLFTEEESELLQDWNGHWYPAYMPEELQLVAAGSDDERFLLYFKSADESAKVKIIEMPLDMLIGMDTDTTTMEEISIGYHKGYLFEDKENASITLFLLMDGLQIEMRVDGKLDKDTVLKIAESLEYVK